MNHRERILAALRGQPSDQIPWSPRMDLWCIALRARGTLPPRFAGLDLVGISEQLDCACHVAQGADYTIVGERDLTLRGLGFDNHPDYPFRVELVGLPMRFEPKTHCVTSVGLDPRTQDGELLWKFDAEAPIESSPVVSGDSVLFGSERDFFIPAPGKGSQAYQGRDFRQIPGCRPKVFFLPLAAHLIQP